MIIACPACSTRYVVPDAAIGIEGRTVRCAKCKHSWHQNGPELELTDPATVADMAGDTAPTRQPAPQPPRASHATPASDTIPAPGPSQKAAPEPIRESRRSQPLPVAETPEHSGAPPFGKGGIEAADARASSSAPDPVREPESDVSQFDSAPPFRSRRNPLKLWTAAAAIFAVLAIGGIVAINFVGAPDWLPVSKPTFAMGQPDLVLDFPPDQQDRRELPNGTEFFGIAGTIKNVGQETRKVPSLWIVMRNQREAIVFEYEVVPPRPTLAPGEHMTINDIAIDLPKTAKVAEIGWKPA